MNSAFPSTQWSLVLSVGDPRFVQNALAALCEAYWFPLYAYVRRRGVQEAEAQDLTQEFFAHLLEKHALARAHPERGRFRSFLLIAFRNFLHNEWVRARTDKRGGGRQVLSLDFALGESRLLLEPSHTESPETLFDREWALSLLDTVMRRLEMDQATPEKAALFRVLKPFLTGIGASHAEPARQANMSEAAFRQAVHRLRKRYRELLREEVARTVADEQMVDDEIRRLFATFQS